MIKIGTNRNPFLWVEPAEPGKKKTAVQAAMILLFCFVGAVWQGSLFFSPTPPAPIKISLVPNRPVPPTPPPPPEPETPEAPLPDETETAKAAEEKAAEVLRDKQKKAEEQKQKETEQKKREEEKKKAEAEQKKKEEEKKRREEEKRKEAERKKREAEEAERKRKEEAQRKAEEAQARQEQLLQKRLSRIESDIAGRIRARINDFLKTPLSVPKSNEVEVILLVTLLPDGSLQTIPEVVESSGYPEYDESVVQAVLKAAPLPMPDDAFIRDNPRIMSRFLEHYIRVNPVQ